MRHLAIAALGGTLGLAVSLMNAPAWGDTPSQGKSLEERCEAIWGEIGRPHSHKDPGTLLLGPGVPEQGESAGQIPPDPPWVCRDHYAVQYNLFTKNPDFVVEKLDASTTTSRHKRPHTGFKVDPELDDASKALSAVDKDYANSGYARGHNAASADFASDEQHMIDTFYFTNSIPQQGHGFNSSIWRELESRVQDLAISLEEGDVVYVITGPVDMPADGKPLVVNASDNACGFEVRMAGVEDVKGQKAAICPDNSSKKDPDATCPHGVQVPGGMFKIVYLPHSDRVFGWAMANISHTAAKRDLGISTDEYFKRWQLSVRAIEQLTQLDFFPGFENRWRNSREGHCKPPQFRK